MLLWAMIWCQNLSRRFGMKSMGVQFFASKRTRLAQLGISLRNCFKSVRTSRRRDMNSNRKRSNLYSRTTTIATRRLRSCLRKSISSKSSWSNRNSLTCCSHARAASIISYRSSRKSQCNPGKPQMWLSINYITDLQGSSISSESLRIILLRFPQLQYLSHRIKTISSIA